MRSLGFNPDDTLPKTFDLRAGRGAARPAGHPVRRGLRGRRGALHHDAAEHARRSTPTCAARSRTRSTASRAARSASRTAGRSSTACSACARASGTATTAAGSIASNDTTGEILDRNVNYSNSDGRPPRGGLEAHANFTVTPSIMYQQPGQERRLDVLAGLFRCGRRAFQHGDAGARRRPGHVLPAGAQGAVGFGQHASSSPTPRTSTASRSPPTRARYTISPTGRAFRGGERLRAGILVSADRCQRHPPAGRHWRARRRRTP